MENYDLYQNYIVSGFYYQHIKNLFEHFTEKQVLTVLHDDLLKDPNEFIKIIFNFLGVDKDFAPTVLKKSINQAATQVAPFNTMERRNLVHSMLSNLSENTFIQKVKRNIDRRVLHRLSTKNKIENEYTRGMDKKIRSELREIFRSDIANLASLLGRDLSSWN